MKKMDRKTFGAIAYTTIAFGSAAATVAISYGIGFLGGVATCDSIGLFKKHPRITGLVGAMTGAFAITMVCCNSESVARSEVNYVENATERLTDLFYGPSDEEEVTED